jgi:magnesium-transporting ATPase (P-type)
MAHANTPLQRAVRRLVSTLVIAALAACVILVIARLVQGHGWLDAIISAVTLATAALPEEFPVIFAFFLGVGVYRLAKRGALVRRAVSVENIGRVTTICSDKTGTMTVRRHSAAPFVTARRPPVESRTMVHATPLAREQWSERVATLAKAGHKVIACASVTLREDQQTDAEPTDAYDMAGLLAFEDPSAPASRMRPRSAGWPEFTR